MALFKTQSVDALDKTRGSPGYRRSASVIVAPSSGGLSLAATGGPAPRAKIPSWYRNLHQTLLGDDERSASLDDLDDDSIQDRSTAAAAAAARSATGKLRSESVDMGSYSRSMTALPVRGRPTPLCEINEEFKGFLGTTATAATSSKSTRHVTGVAGVGATRQQQSQQQQQQQHQPRLIDIDHRPTNDTPVRPQAPSPSPSPTPAAAAATTTTTVSHREVATETAPDDESDVIDAVMADTDDEVLVYQPDDSSEPETQHVNNIRRRTTVCDKVIQVDEDLDSPSPASLPPLPRSPPPPLPLSCPPPQPRLQPSDVNTTDRQVELVDTPPQIGRHIAIETPMAKAVMAEASTTSGSQQPYSVSAETSDVDHNHNVEHPSTGPTPRTRSSVKSTSPLTFSISGGDDVPSNRKQLEKKKFVPRFSTGGGADFTSAVGVNGASGGMSRQSSVQSSNKVDWRRREAVTSAPLGLQAPISQGSSTDGRQQQQRHGSTSRDLAKTTPTDDRKFRPEKPPNERTKQLIADDDEGRFLRCRSLKTIPSETAERRLMDIEIPRRDGHVGSSGAVAQTGTQKMSGGRPRSSSDGLDSRTSRDLTLATSDGSSSGGNSNHQQATAPNSNGSTSGERYVTHPVVTAQPPPPTDHVTNGRPAGRPDASAVEVKGTSTPPTRSTNGGSVRGSDDLTPIVDGRQSTTTSSSSFDVKSSQKSFIPQEATANKKQYKWTVHESTPLGRPRTAAATKPSSASTTSSSGSIKPAATYRPTQAATRSDIGSATHNATTGFNRKEELRRDAKLTRSHQNDATYTAESTRTQPETPPLTFSAYNGRHDEAARPTNGASVQQSAAAAAEPGRQQNLVAASTGRMQSALAKFRSMESLVASAPTPVPISMSTAETTATHRVAHTSSTADRGSRNTGTGTGKPNATGYGINRGLDGSGTVRSAATTTMTKFRSMENIDGGTTFGIAASPTHVENLELYQIDAGKMTGLGSEQIRQKETRLENRTPTAATQRRQETSTQLFKYRSLEDVLTPTSASASASASERLHVANGDCQTSGKAGMSLTMPGKRAAEASTKAVNKPETKNVAAEVAKQPEIRSAAPEINRDEIPAGNPVTNGEKMSSSNDKEDTSDSGTTDNNPATAQHVEAGVPSRYSFIPKYQSMEDIVTDLPRIGRPQRWQKAAPAAGQPQSSSAASRRSFSVGDVSGGRLQDEAAVDGRGFRSALNSVDGAGSDYSSSADCNGDGAADEVMATVAPWNDEDQSRAERAAANRDVVKSCLFIKLQTPENRSDEVAATAAAPAPIRIRIVSVRRQN